MNVKFDTDPNFQFSNQSIEKQGFSINAFQENFLNIQQCVHCSQNWQNPNCFDLFQRLLVCQKKGFCLKQRRQDQPPIIQHSNPDEIPSLKENDHNFSQLTNNQQLLQSHLINDVENEIERLLMAGNLSDITIKQYKGPLRRFYLWLWQMQKRHPTSTDIVNYAQSMNLTLPDLKALGRLRKIERIILKEEETMFLKQTKKFLKEGKTGNPNISWSIQTIQEFIDDLVQHKMENLAFRIFVLYYLGARISELSQITFKQICSGVVSYIPKKQIKSGSKAERILEIPKHIINIIKEYMEFKSLTQDLYLNQGEYKTYISYNAMRKQLCEALLYLRKGKSRKTQDYLQFLEHFSYHDLRHSRLCHLFDQGAEISQIQEFIKHTDQKCTKAYLKSAKQRKMNLNAEIIKMDQTPNLVLNLQLFPKKR